ncbi:MAG: hypothetical protein WCF68_19820 [Terriglobales bacterium]
MPYAAAQKDCSTEKVNGSCIVTIDRNYPVTMPTFQMRPGTTITVNVVNPLPFETLTLDPQTAQAVAGTDQVAGLVTGVMPYVKGLAESTKVYGFDYLITAKAFNPEIEGQPDQQNLAKVKSELKDLDETLKAVYKPLTDFGGDATKVYAQLQEILAPVPRPLDATAGASTIVRPAAIPPDTPNPWDEYPTWRAWLLHELVGSPCSGGPCSTIANLMGTASGLQASLTAAAATPTNFPIFDTNASNAFDSKVAVAETDIRLLGAGDQAKYSSILDRLKSRKAVLVASLPSYSVAISSVVKDLQTYLANIYQAEGMDRRDTPKQLGKIYDPRTSKKVGVATQLLGRQVSFSVSAVNEVGTPVASVPSATQKKSIATITVLYADPIFEVSAGAFFSTLPYRSFANQTVVTQNPGTSPTPGDVVIVQTITRPTIVPFAAANWRLGHDFTWPDYRRGAFYFTTAIGLNPNNSTAEFGIGPSISWRSVMFSPMLHIGHDIRLTQGEFVGEIWCNQTAANGSVPKCSGGPPSPSTERFWTSAFALGISIRVPSVFGSASH